MAKLYFRYGAMNSGKSTALMQVAHNYEEQGMRVLILKPQVDTKGGGELVSRLGVRRKADLLIPPETDVFEAVRTANADGAPLACVLCDESQFFTAQQAEQLFMVTVDLNIPVICYGLRADFSLKGFPGSTRLLELAHTIEEMKTICTCGRKAICNCRKVNGQFVFEGEQVAIDLENDVQYVSMCPQWFHVHHLNTSTGKMSKSKGEFLTVSLLEEKGYDPLIYRFFCLQSHYRKALVFTWENLDNAKIAYDKLIARIAALNPENGSVDEASMSVLKEKFQKALDADLNTSLAITTLYDVLKADMNDATKLALLDNFDQVLGLALLSHAEAKRKEAAKTTSASTASGYQITGEGDPEIDALVLKRYEAKKAKNFAEADKIRDDLKAQGIEVADVRGGAVWKRI